MAQSTNTQNTVTVGSATTSDWLSLNDGSAWAIEVTSAGAFVADIQASVGTDFADVYLDASTKATISSTSGPRILIVAGGLNYRINVTTFNSTVTMKADPVRI